jgi:hypothetical protein
MSFAKPIKPFADRENDDARQERANMCKAHECPNRWSVAPDMLCSAHAWSPMHLWPQITDEQHRHLASRSNRPQNTEPPRKVTREEVNKARDGLKAFVRGNQLDPKQWARNLKAREQAGEHLSDVQRKMWRAALNERSSSQDDS